MGSATPRSISRGKRTIVGSFVAILFDRDPLSDLMLDPTKWYYAHRNEVNFLRNPVNAAAPIRAIGVEGVVNDRGVLTGGTSFEGSAGTPLVNQIEQEQGRQGGRTGDSYAGFNDIPGLGDDTTTSLRTQGFQNVGTQFGFADYNAVEFSPLARATGFELITNGELPAGAIVDGEAVTVRRAATYPDQMLPFDITLVAQNEMGQAAWMSINACEVINEGQIPETLNKLTQIGEIVSKDDNTEIYADAA